MIYELWCDHHLLSCTANHSWLIEEAVPFHKRFNRGRFLITCRPEE